MNKRSILRLVTLDATINGGFSADTDWTKGTDWSIAGNLATHVDGAASDLEEEVASLPPVGRLAYITYTVARTAGDVTVKAGTAAGTARDSAATYTDVLTVVGDQVLRFSASADFAGSVTDVKVRYAAEGDSESPDDGVALKKGEIDEVTIVNAGSNLAHVAWEEGSFAQATMESMDFSSGDSYPMNNKQFDNFSALADADGSEVDIQIIINGRSGV